MIQILFSAKVLDQYDRAPAPIQKSFQKQLLLLENNLLHPSLHAKKYSEAENVWQARINRDWRFYFTIHEDKYTILTMQKHPK